MALNLFISLDCPHCSPVSQDRVRRAPGLLPGEVQALAQSSALGHQICTEQATVKPSSALPKHWMDEL